LRTRSTSRRYNSFPQLQLDLAVDIDLLQKKIADTIRSIKDENTRRLDEFLVQYTQSFQTLKKNMDGFFLLSRKNFFYSNANTLQMKLASLPPAEAQTLISSNDVNVPLSSQEPPQLDENIELAEQ
jgi:hypothetical protein